MLKQQKQNCGDKCAGVTDADPPDEVHDRKSPRDRNVDPPDADAAQQQPRDREEEQHQQAERDDESDPPRRRLSVAQNNRADRFVDRLVGLAGREQIRRIAERRDILRACVTSVRLGGIVFHSCPETPVSRVRIAQACAEISRARARVQFGEHAVVQRRLLELRNAALRIVDVAEDDRFGRANLRAGGNDFAIADLAIVSSSAA